MSSVPRIRTRLTVHHMGDNFASTAAASGTTEALLVSEPHYKLPNGAWSGGGPFYQVTNRVLHTGIKAYDIRYVGTRYRGNMGCVSPGPLRPPPFAPTPFSSVADSLSGKYATGYARTRPGNPVAGLGQFLVELRDLPKIPFKNGWSKGNFGVPIQQVPRVLWERLKDYKNLGSEYLNVQFGWVPFVNDVKKMYYLWHDIDKRMAQIVRENGRYIRRKATIENENSTTQETVHSPGSAGANVRYFINLAPSGVDPRSSTWTYTRTTKHKSWFVGSYRYYIPDVGSSLWDKRARAALFGALPTPELLWNVLPWSWLVDWFSNVGDVISNVGPNAVDNLTLRYSFVMEHTTDVQEWRVHSEHGALETWSPTRPFGYLSPGGSDTWATTWSSESKARLGGGNPFGLNVKLGSLSAYQLSILAALGLSRGAVK